MKMPFFLNNKQREDLSELRQSSPGEIINWCKSAFDYLAHGPNTHHGNFTRHTVKEGLISLLIDAAKAPHEGAVELQRELGLTEEAAEILAQFVTSKRGFIEGSIKSANIRDYRLVNLDWRLEVRVASRCVLRQNTILVTMKLYLHTEPKNENRDLVGVEGGSETIHPDEQRNRKDLLVQTDVNSLKYMIQALEDALNEAKTRRIRNIVDAIH